MSPAQEADMPIISSTQNPHIKRIRALRLRKERERTQCFFVEGLQSLIEATQFEAPIETLVVAPELLASQRARALVAQQIARGVACLEVTADVFDTLAAKDVAQGVAAIVRQRWCGLAGIRPDPQSCWVALDSIQYPGNLGTILRTCDAIGGAGVILLGPTSDPYDPAAVRASVGAIFSQQLVRAGVAEFADWKRERHVMVAGTSPAAAVDYRTVAYQPPVALLMGCERSGLPPPLQALCDVMVHIPMRGRSDSLNLAVATSLMLYEVFRQQRPAELAR
jgi:TrmH family RNA methyltransferase